MKTKGMPHQLDALRELNGKKYFALFMEMGTGKTWTILADAERAYAAGKIDGLLVIAPKGVHTNWVRREIPMHLDCKYIAAAFSSGNTTRKYRASMDALFKQREFGEPPPLRILSINIDAITTKAGFAAAENFLLATKAMVVVDESQRIKTPSAARTKAAMKIGARAVARRICSGLPVTNAPMDLFSQMEFLSHGLLGTTSYRAFVAEYAELLSENNPLVKHIAANAPNARSTPQIIARNRDGTPKWRNLDRLAKLIEPHSFRVLKKDCLELPDKIYTTVEFELDSAQRKHYDMMATELRIELGDQPDIVSALAALLKLQQITSGFVMLDGTTRLLPNAENTRMKALKDALQDIDGQFIIWARFREELRQIAELLQSMDISFVEYHGGVGDKDREMAVDKFQAGTARAFVAQPQSGGTGLTLTAAETVIYYSNDFNLDTRRQSEDRAHRIGTKKNVVYIDLVAEDTIDEKIARSLQAKQLISSQIMGDNTLDLAIATTEN